MDPDIYVIYVYEPEGEAMIRNQRSDIREHVKSVLILWRSSNGLFCGVKGEQIKKKICY